MKTTLVIMAAGIGSRFSGGIKQLETINEAETIMDYSIYDAIEAGFNKIIFVIRKSIKEEFNKIIINRIEKACRAKGVQLLYTFQELTDIPEGFIINSQRQKPWGTGQAVLSCKSLIKEPFVVINADDYYGKEAFRRLHDFITKNNSNQLCMAGYKLKNTLSEFGGVTRGVCEVKNGYLTSITETKNITADTNIDKNSIVSMNMWGMPAGFVNTLESGFKEFLLNSEIDLMQDEFLLPIYISKLLKENRVSVRVLNTADRWFGLTYKEDKTNVVNSFQKLIADGVYPGNLWEE